MYASHVDERQFFTEKPEQRPARLHCPACRRTNDYPIRWLRRTKKDQVPAGADARDRAMFDKVKDHLVRVDDDVTCKTCGQGFEIPSHAPLVFLEELEGLPKVDYDGEGSGIGARDPAGPVSPGTSASAPAAIAPGTAAPRQRKPTLLQRNRDQQIDGS